MADWQDMGDGYVRNPAGLEVPREMVPPTDRIMPPQGAAPVAATTPVAGAPAPAAPGAPMAPLSAASTLAKLDQPAIAAARGTKKYTEQISSTTQNAVPMSVLKPVMDRGTARAETQAASAVNLGEARAQTIEKQADAQTYAAQGQQAASLADQEDARQRADIARQNQIAISAQEDPEIDPGRYISNMTTGQSVGTIILAAIEGAFRGMTGQAGQSGVAALLERRIDQDLMAQKEQIASGRIRRGNMISYFREQGMNEEAAEKAAKAMAYAQAEKLTQAEIARQGAGTTRAEGAALAEQIKAAREQANDELVLTLGTPRSSTSTVKTEVTGTAGAGTEAFTKQLVARQAYEESGATPEQLSAFDAALGIPSPRGESKFAQDKRKADKPSVEEAKKADALSTMQGLADSLGGLPDRVYTAESASLPKKLAHGAADLAFGEGMGEKMDLTLSKKDLEDSQKFTQARSSYLSMLSVLNGQGAMADQEYNNALKAAGAANSPAQLRAAIDNTLKARGSQLRTPEQAGFKKVAP